MTGARWWRVIGGDTRLSVRLTPKGGADRIDGAITLADGSRVLAARVRAPADKGKANAALERLVARALGVAPARVTIVSGHKARVKTVDVAAGAHDLGAKLAALEQPNEGKHSQ